MKYLSPRTAFSLSLFAVFSAAAHGSSLPAAQNASSASPASLDVPRPAPKAVYNVRDYGAVGDGKTKDTQAFQKALDTCAVNGGGEVDVPAGEYLIGSIQLGAHTLLHLEKDTLLTGSPDLDDYPLMDIRWEGRREQGHRSLIYAAEVEDVGIIGPGAIRGDNGVAASNTEPRGALIIEPIDCRGVRIEGLGVTQGGNNWAVHPTYCTDVLIKNINLYGRRDGLDIDSCKNVLITGCNLDTGDDSISLKSGRGMDGARLGRPVEDVLITHCTLRDRTFACLGIGSEISGGVRNVRVEHCQLSAPSAQAIYLKTRIGRAGVTENLSCDDLDILAGDFLRLNLTRGGNTNTADDPVPGAIGYPQARNLSFTNIRVAGRALVTATDISALAPLTGLTLANITGTCAKGITLANMSGVEIKNINVTGFTGPLLSLVNVTGAGLDGAAAIPAPVDPAPVSR
ncbi:MAG TPA: glycosyl hydrolase family 28-related protein [Opitutales bacterium]|nr:glycosyl hydrolase family 28-related protein [Opitutales bacterium]